MNVARLSLVVSCLLGTAAHAAHPITPTNLRQNLGGPTGPAIAPGGAVPPGTDVYLTATMPGATNGTGCYDVQLEIREVSQPFTGVPTHSAGIFNGNKSATDVEAVGLTFQPPAGDWKWQARMSSGSSCPGTQSTWALFNAGNHAFTILSVQLTPTSVSFGGQKVGSASAAQQLTLENQSGAPVTISTASVTGPFSLVNGPSLPVNLANNATVTFDVTATPPAIGNHTGTFTVQTSAPNSPHTATLSVTGADPQLTAAPATVAFGEWGINGAAATRQLTVQNTGNAPLTVTGHSVTGPFSVTGMPQAPLAPGASVAVTVSFLPTAVGAQAGTLTLQSDDPNGPHTVALVGTGTQPQLVLSPSSLSFPNVVVGAQSAPLTFSVGNTGVGTLNLLSPTVNGPFTTTLVSGTVPQGDSKSWAVTFAPQTPGPFSGSVVIGSDSTGQPHTLALSGTAIAAIAEASPAQVSAGPVALGAAQMNPVTLTNTGDSPLTVTNISISGGATGEFTLSGTPPLPFTLPPGDARLFAVRFAPSTVGQRSGQVTVTSNRYPAGPLVIPVGGEGLGPQLSVAPASLAFPNTNVGSQSVQTLTLSNGGTSSLQISGLVFSTGAAVDFTTTQPLPLTLAPGGTHQLSVRFQPTVGGTRSSTLQVVSSDPLKPSVGVPVSGTAQSPMMSLEPSSLTFAPTRVGQSQQRTLTLTNTGNGPLAVNALTFIGNDSPRFTLGGVGVPFVLPPGQPAVNITVTFQPNAVGAASATLHVVTDDPATPSMQIPITGEGIAPDLQLSTTNLAFGAQVVGRPSSPRTFQITNSGNAALQVFSLAITGAGGSAFAVTSPTGGFTVNAGESRMVSVTLTANAVAEQVARLNIQSDRPGGGAAHVELLGLGISEVFGASPTVANFGIVKAGTSSAPYEVTLTNHSAETLTMAPAQLAGVAPEQFQVVFTAAQVPPAGQVVARVTYRPQVAGEHAAELRLLSSDPAVPHASVTLTGGALSQVLEAQPSLHDFGQVRVGQRVSQTLTLTNKTDAPLALASVSSSDPSFVVEPGAPSTVMPGVGAPLTVSYVPTAPGAHFATIGVSLEGQTGSQEELTVSVSGTGTPAEEEGGCAAAGGPSLAWLLLGALPALRRRRGAFAAGASRLSRAAPWALALAVGLGLSFPAFAIHPTNVKNLRQQTGSGSPLTAGATTSEATVSVTATSDSATCDTATLNYQLQVEVRPVGQSFSNTATHTSPMMAKPSCVDLEYPLTALTSLPSGTYKWQAREIALGLPGAWQQFNAGNAAFTVVSVQMNPSQLAFGGRKVGVQSAPLPVALENLSNDPVTVTSTSFTGPFALVSGPSLPTVLAPGSQLVFGVVATPPSIGSHAGTLSVATNAPTSPHTVALTVTGADPQVTLPQTSVAFGSWGINGAPSTRQVTVQNTGNAPLTVTSGAVAAPFGTTGLAGLQVPAGGSAQFTVTFAPTTSGAHAATLNIHSDAPGSPHAVSLTGTGTTPQLTLNPSSLSFGNVVVGAQSAAVSFEVGNTGTGDLNLLTPVVNGPFTTTLAPGQVAQGGVSTFTAQFSPAAPGPVSGSVIIHSDSQGSPHILTLTGTALAPLAVFSPLQVAHGPVALGASDTQPLTLNNPGDAPLTVTDLSLAGGAAGEFTLSPAPSLPLTVPAGGSTQVQVQFEPAGVGPRSATLTLQSNRYPAGALTVAVSGIGMGALQTLSANALEYGPVNMGATAFRTLTVSNSGNLPLQVTGLVFSGAAASDFNVAQALPVTVNPGQSSTVEVAFSPSMAGTRSATLTVTSDAPGSPTVQVAVTGVGQSATLAFNPMNVAFGQVRVGRTQVRQVTLQNTGTGPLTVTDLSVVGPDAARFTHPAGLVPMVLQPGAPGAIIPFTFAPTAVGAALATLNIASDDPQAPSAQIAIGGEGIAPGIAVSETGLAFGAQAVGRASSPRTFEVQNTGTAPLQVFSLAITGTHSGAFAVVSPSGPFQVAPGASRTVSVTMTAGVAGEISARLNIQSDAPGGAAAQVDLVGLGISDTLQASGTSLDFGLWKVGMSSTPRTVTLQNLGADALPLAPAQVTGTHAGAFRVTFDPSQVDGQGEVQVQVTFVPRTSGVHQAQLRLASTDTRLPAVVVTLQGAGVVRALEASPTSHDFASLRVGEEAQQGFSVLNRTGQPLQLGELVSSHPAFVIAEGAPTEIQPGASATVNVVYRPTEAGSHAGAISLSLAGESAAELTLPVTGSATAPAEEEGGGGCAAAGGLPLGWLLLGLGVPALRRSSRRRQR